MITPSDLELEEVAEKTAGSCGFCTSKDLYLEWAEKIIIAWEEIRTDPLQKNLLDCLKDVIPYMGDESCPQHVIDRAWIVVENAE